jgi:hypothetical protein
MRRGRAGRPFPLPAELDLPVIEWAGWTATPAQPPNKARWERPLRVYTVAEPEKLSFRVIRQWSGFLVVGLYKGARRIGAVALEEARQDGEEVWVVTKSHLKEDYRGRGLGSLMYLVTKAVLDAYQFRPTKMISTQDRIGSGTSSAAQAVWKRLRGAGRVNFRR